MDVLYSKVTIVHNAIHCVFESCQENKSSYNKRKIVTTCRNVNQTSCGDKKWTHLQIDLVLTFDKRKRGYWKLFWKVNLGEEETEKRPWKENQSFLVKHAQGDYTL